MLAEHEINCGCEVAVRQSIIHKSTELSSKLAYQGIFEHDIIYNPRGECIHTKTDCKTLEQGWAYRPVDGYTIGENNEPQYRLLVDKCIDI